MAEDILMVNFNIKQSIFFTTHVLFMLIWKVDFD